VSALSLELALELVDSGGINLGINIAGNSNVNVELSLLRAVGEAALSGGDFGNDLGSLDVEDVDLANDFTAANLLV